MWRRLLLTSLMTVAALNGIASGQAGGGMGLSHSPSVTPGFAGFGTTSTTGMGRAFQHHSFGRAPVVFFSDLGYESVPNQPISIFVVQPPAPAATPIAEESHPPEKPLLLELQGDRWVQVDHFQMTRSADPNVPTKTAQAVKTARLETLLIFRNGRSEMTSSYAVIGDALYEQRNYWTSGTWTKKIPVADLDLPATIRANQERGIAFKMPAGPNEVVLQP